MDYDYLKYKKILIVDDEADLREMVTSILDQDGFKIIKTAGTVAEALKICREWEPDLAVLDVILIFPHLKRVVGKIVDFLKRNISDF